MIIVRRFLRPCVAAWLAFHLTSLSALVPRDCCAAHRRQASGPAQHCHESLAPAHCSMGATDGPACPMHEGDDASAATVPDRTCSMRGACNGPMAALGTLLWQCVVPDGQPISRDAAIALAPVHPQDPPILRLTAPDPPPPRA